MTTAKLADLAKAVRLDYTEGAKLAWEKQDEWQQNANGYRCTITYKRRRYSFDYWQGTGIKHDPTVEGCLDSLLSDAEGGEQDFEEFCANFDYDTDSRKAEKTWKSCRKISAAMQRLLGDDYESFKYAERD